MSLEENMGPREEFPHLQHSTNHPGSTKCIEEWKINVKFFWKIISEVAVTGNDWLMLLTMIGTMSNLGSQPWEFAYPAYLQLKLPKTCYLHVSLYLLSLPQWIQMACDLIKVSAIVQMHVVKCVINTSSRSSKSMKTKLQKLNFKRHFYVNLVML